MKLIELICQEKCINLQHALENLLQDDETQRECFALLTKVSSQLPSRIVDVLLSHCNWDSVSYSAAKLNQQDIIFELEKEEERIDWDEVLCGACNGGHFQLVQYSICKGATIMGDALCGACRLNDSTILEYLIPLLNDSHFKNNHLWTTFLHGLLKTKKMKLAYWLIENVEKAQKVQKYKDEFFRELIHTGAYEGSIDFVEEMLKKAKQDILSPELLEWILKNSCARAYMAMIHWVIKHGAKNFQEGMDAAITYSNTNAIRLMKTYGANDYGLLDVYNDMINKIKPYFYSLFCHDIFTILSEFIDIDYEDKWVKRLQESTFCKR